MGVLENVEVLGRSGADLETELLHHEASPRAPGAIDTSTALAASATGGDTAADQPGGETTLHVPKSTGAETFQQTGDSNDLGGSLGAGAIAPPDSSPPAEPEGSPDPGVRPDAEAGDTNAQPPLES